MKKTGFACAIDCGIELDHGFICPVYPHPRAAPECCQPELSLLEIYPIGNVVSERGAITNPIRGRDIYFMREIDLEEGVPFPECGVPIANSLDQIWRLTGIGARSIVKVKIRFIQTLQEQKRLKAQAFVYEDLYEQLGLVHPEVHTRQ